MLYEVITVRPVWRVQREGVPALRAPGFTDPSPLQHDDTPIVALEVIARRKASLAGANDDDIEQVISDSIHDFTRNNFV